MPNIQEVLLLNGKAIGAFPSSGGGIRYDEENDVIQLYYNGQWVDWKTAGMAYPIGTQTTFGYAGFVDQFEIPATGYWKVELYGAGTGNNGYGGKTTIYEEFQNGDILYVCVGGTNNGTTGGYNGGGNGSTAGPYDTGRGGAGATHIALMDGTLKEIGVQNLAQILGVAGGSGNGYNNEASRKGKGGGETGSNGKGDTIYCGTGGSQSSAGVNTSGNPGAGITVTSSTSGGFGYGGYGNSSNQATYGGGGGLYGGGFAIYNSGSGGGSGYIKNATSKIIGGVTYTPETIQGGGLTSDGSCVFTYLGRTA